MRHQHAGDRKQPDFDEFYQSAYPRLVGQLFSVTGSVEQAEDVFGQIPVDYWLLEYDTERAGGLARRIEEASRYDPLEALVLSLQCGFISEVHGNPLTWDDRRRKFDLMERTAAVVWG